MEVIHLNKRIKGVINRIRKVVLCVYFCMKYLDYLNCSTWEIYSNADICLDYSHETVWKSGKHFFPCDKKKKNHEIFGLFFMVTPWPQFSDKSLVN